MQSSSIQLAVVDMAGTTVADDGLVLTAFDSAATAAGLIHIVRRVTPRVLPVGRNDDHGRVRVAR